ncbi:MAG: SHOCT domain-containing protein [Burkholderiales bacterium]|nr:SHOCT domain-containing protein [Burkholderiales bacterium]
MYGYDHGGWMFGGGIGMILVWLVPIALVIWLVSSWSKRTGQESSEKTALDILKERYAKGEIQQDEFERKKRDLSG